MVGWTWTSKRSVERGCQNVGFILPLIFYGQVALLTKSQGAFFLRKLKYFDDDGQREQYVHDNVVFVATWNKVVNGWYVCHKRDHDGDLLHLPGNLAQRAEMVNALAEEGEWNDVDWMRVCSLSLDGLDNVLNDYEPSCNNRKSNAVPERGGKVLQKAFDDDEKRDPEDFWWTMRVRTRSAWASKST